MFSIHIGVHMALDHQIFKDLLDGIDIQAAKLGLDVLKVLTFLWRTLMN